MGVTIHFEERLKNKARLDALARTAGAAKGTFGKANRIGAGMGGDRLRSGPCGPIHVAIVTLQPCASARRRSLSAIR